MIDYPPAHIGAGTIGFDWTLDHDPGAVWTALSTAESLSRWLGCQATLAPVPGGKMRFDWGEDGVVEGVVTEVEVPRVLRYTWDGTSTVRWEIAPAGDGTRLRLTHSVLATPEAEVRDLAAGWHDFLDALLAELGHEPHHSRYRDLLASYAQR